MANPFRYRHRYSDDLSRFDSTLFPTEAVGSILIEHVFGCFIRGVMTFEAVLVRDERASVDPGILTQFGGMFYPLLGLIRIFPEVLQQCLLKVVGIVVPVCRFLRRLSVLVFFEVAILPNKLESCRGSKCRN